MLAALIGATGQLLNHNQILESGTSQTRLLADQTPVETETTPDPDREASTKACIEASLACLGIPAGQITLPVYVDVEQASSVSALAGTNSTLDFVVVSGEPEKLNLTFESSPPTDQTMEVDVVEGSQETSPGSVTFQPIISKNGGLSESVEVETVSGNTNVREFQPHIQANIPPAKKEVAQPRANDSQAFKLLNELDVRDEMQLSHSQQQLSPPVKASLPTEATYKPVAPNTNLPITTDINSPNQPKVQNIDHSVDQSKPLLKAEEIYDTPVTIVQTDTRIASESKVATTNLTTSQQTATTHPQLSVVNQILEKINVLKRGENAEVRLQLQPESLGHVLVKLQMDHGDLSIHILAESSQAQSLIQDNLAHFKANLNIQGLQVDNLAVSVGSDSSSFDTSGRQPNANFEIMASQQQKTSQDPSSLETSTSNRVSWRNSLNVIDYQV